MKRPSKLGNAFQELPNLFGLAIAVAASAALLNPLPLMAALAIEAGYLLFVPDSKWYEKRLAAKYDNEVIERRKRLKEQIFPNLGYDMQSRFVRLETVREQVGNQTFDGRLIFREVLRKLDYLLEKFLMFASKEVEFENYLRSVLQEVKNVPLAPPVVNKKGKRPDFDIQDLAERDSWIKTTVDTISSKYTEEIAEIDGLMQKDENLHNQAILDKRKEVLQRRSEYVVRIGEILINVGHQLHLMEDTFGLINDEIRARSPEQVLADIDDVVFQTDSLTESLQDIAPFDMMPLEAGARKLYDATHEK